MSASGVPRKGGRGVEAPVVRRWRRTARCVSLARHELRLVLIGWELAGLTDAAELVLSELFTNAVRHARVPRDRLVETRYERLSSGVRIEVHDADETRPVVRAASMDAESGRGLALVDALTGGCWGVSVREGAGKLLWAVVADDGVEHRPGRDGCGEQGL
ncbi:ATP-binding protein [Streptomyces sp. NBC_01476]|uniref:ATP-binding protein n=1 Tax=Streptomyces sp. NBC_01476 TaxID=2903881 RepID=UPI002E3283EB|nr:ATP-binding protein [Streptomyces sp. NBC_01476]